MCVRSKENEKKNEIPPDAEKTHHEIYPQQPGDRDHLERACSETRATRYPILALFLHRSRVCGNRPRYTHVCIYSHCCCCCAACVRFGALYYFLASEDSSFSAVILVCMYRRFRVCPVVVNIELSVSAWYHKTQCVQLRARHLLLLLFLTAESKERRLAVCGVTFKLASNRAETI